MKKTISINISGVIFHIEEDGYDKLKSYLTTVQQYFSTYEDSQEIVTDIENRIAEKLLAKLKSADKQVVSLEDVNELTAAMGTVADFEAVEEEEVLVTNGGRHSATGEGQGTNQTKAFQSRRNPSALYRRPQRRTPPTCARSASENPRWCMCRFGPLLQYGRSVGTADFSGSVSGLPPLGPWVWSRCVGFHLYHLHCDVDCPARCYDD